MWDWCKEALGYVGLCVIVYVHIFEGKGRKVMAASVVKHEMYVDKFCYRIYNEIKECQEDTKGEVSR